MPINRTFRLFISSTFSDFIAEREALQRDVFPKLERFCAERGARFQAVDLRWGITEEAQREHDTMRICLEEVRRSQELSPRPNFAILLGDRYGWEPVPARVPQSHWDRLIAAASADDRKLIQSGYKGPDFNSVPPTYHLHERVGSWADNEARESKLRTALRSAADAANFQGDDRLPYFASATHQEVALGALSGEDVAQHVHAYVRKLVNLPLDSSASNFIDWNSQTSAVVIGARQRLSDLEASLRERLGGNVHDYCTEWSRHGTEGATDSEYLNEFCNNFLSHQTALIEAELKSLGIFDEMQERERVHVEFGINRSKVFAGRQKLLKQIAQYTGTVKPEKNAYPLILVGSGGSGKSALLAKAARIDLEAQSTNAVIVQRYIGGVPGTESLKGLLTDLIKDIAQTYGYPEPAVPVTLNQLSECFLESLWYSTAERPLHLYLDALDQLDSADNAWMLEWLPRELPKHSRVVVSLRNGTIIEQTARRIFTKGLVDVPAMTQKDGRAMLDAWLEDKEAAWFNAGIAPSTGRQLMPKQKQAVLKAFGENGSALWLKLAYEEASTWTSWSPARDLPSSVAGLIHELIETRLLKRENHPKVFTERALTYLTAGRFGLSEDELARALGTDDQVREEFKTNEKSKVKWDSTKSLPPILWSRLFFDLQPYLGLSEVDGALVMRWFHREFSEVVRDKYLSTQGARKTIHLGLSKVFKDLETELRPMETNDDSLFRNTDISSKQLSVALRRIMEQPWQLAKAGLIDEIHELLNNLGFCLAKCAANRSSDLVSDIVLASDLTNQISPWMERIIGWNSLFLKADSIWPAHRILIQFILEAPEIPQYIEASKANLRGDYAWPIYLKGEVSNYGSALARSVQFPHSSGIYYPGMFMVEDRIDSSVRGQKYWDPAANSLQFEIFTRYVTNISRVALIDGHMLIVENAIGESCIIDINTSKIEAIGDAGLVIANIDWSRNTWTELEKDPICDERLPFAIQCSYGDLGCVPLEMKGGQGLVILGKGKAHLICDLLDSHFAIFACDSCFFIIDREKVREFESGSYTYLGEKLSSKIRSGVDYQRFKSIVFIDKYQFLSLGFKSYSLDGRQDIGIELFKVESEHVVKVCDIALDNRIDLPIPLIAGMKDGGILLTCENYLRTFAFWPPYEDNQDLLAERVRADWYRKNNTEESTESIQYLIRFKRPFSNYFQEECPVWIAEGPFAGEDLNGIHAHESHNLLDLGDDDSQQYIQFSGAKGLGRWFSDVSIEYAVEMDPNAFVVIKSTGPVVVKLVSEGTNT